MHSLPVKSRGCVSCGARSWGRFLKVGGFVVDECQVCGLGRTRIARKEKQKVDQEFYGDQYRDFYTNRKTKRLLIRRFRKQIKRVLSHFRGVRKVLDVGCSYGYFLEVAGEFGWEAVGLEPSELIFQNLRRHATQLKVINSTLREAELKKKFDLVTYWDVLEHIVNPDQELDMVKRVLRPGGYLIVQCPNKASWSAILSGSKWGWWIPPDHVYHFTPSSLRNLVEQSGFKTLFMETYNDEEEIVRGVFNRLMPEGIPRLAAWLDLSHRLVQKVGYPVLYPLRAIEGRIGAGGLNFLLAQKK